MLRCTLTNIELAVKKMKAMYMDRYTLLLRSNASRAGRDSAHHRVPARVLTTTLMTVWAGALALLLPVLGATEAAAQPGVGVDDEYRAAPDYIWDLQTPDPNTRHTADLRALVFDLEQVGNRVYAGGKFLEARHPNGTVVARPYLAAFDVQTGALIQSFSPNLDGPVYAMEPTGDGRILVGGELTGGVRIVDSAGNVSPGFSPNFANTWGPPAVWDLELVGSSLYVVGSFNRFNGSVRNNAAKVSFPDGTLDPNWDVSAIGIDDGSRLSGSGLVWAVEVDPDRDRVYLAGKFDQVNRDPNSDNFVILTTTDGSLRTDVPQSDPVGALNHDSCAPGDTTCWHIDNWYYDVALDGPYVYLGGQAHTTIKLNASDLSVIGGTFTNRGLGDVSAGGDTQVIHVGQNTIWSGCHCWGSVGWFEALDHEMFGREYTAFVQAFREVDNQPARGLYGIDRDSNSVTPQVFELTGQSGAMGTIGGLQRSSLGRGSI